MNQVRPRRSAVHMPVRIVLALVLIVTAQAWAAEHELNLALRCRKEVPELKGVWEVVEKKATWSGRDTALIICDAWDTHTCAGAVRRLEAMVPRMNATIRALRQRGVLIIHAPSDTMKFYEQTPQRALARNAPKTEPPLPIRSWNPLDPSAEAPLPIDDSDGGCDCQPPCPRNVPYPWTRQHPGIELVAGDAVSDSGQEIFNLLRQRDIRHVLFMGVHTNMCVLGRSFGIRQMVRLGFEVALVRDLTDTMYNSRRAPMVAHAKGTELVIEHIEKYWCPSITSSQIMGDPAPPHLVLAIAEDEYDAGNTLPRFARDELEGRMGLRCTILHGQGKNNLPGFQAIADADLLLLYLRRTILPEEQMQLFKAHLEAGKPLVALRTSCHGFENWLEFDQAVLGCSYHGHYGKGQGTLVRAVAGWAKHPVLRGIGSEAFPSDSWLYKVAPLNKTTLPLLVGRQAENPEECVAWLNTYRGGRVFFSSLGHQQDFASPQFRRLLVNAVCWALDRPIPP